MTSTTKAKKSKRATSTVSKDAKAARRKAREEKTAEVLAMLADGVEALKTGEDWARVLKFKRLFHNYSFRNLVLIGKQMPHATQVAGFNTWKKQGRTVKKGEKGIRILAPLIRKTEDENGEEGSELFGVRTVCVFDISQTEGDAVPSIVHDVVCTDEERAIAALECLKDFSENELGLPVSFATLADGVGGYLSLTERKIVVNFQSNFLERAATIAHEIGHALLHLDDESVHARPEQEVEAESVAFCVMNAFGFDTSCYSFGYVAGWSGGDSKKVLLSADRICKAVKRVLASTLDVEVTEQVAA